MKFMKISVDFLLNCYFKYNDDLFNQILSNFQQVCSLIRQTFKIAADLILFEFIMIIFIIFLSSNNFPEDFVVNVEIFL